METLLNGTDIRSSDELHDALKRALDLPEYYGRNLDALWDCLTGGINTPTTLVWRDYEATRKNVGEYAEKVLAVLREAEKEADGFRVELR